MIALTAERRKSLCSHGGSWISAEAATDCPARFLPIPQEVSSHAIVSGILLLPYFCPSGAPLDCEKIILRWPGPFGSGFLSPQPPGAVGIGPVRRGVNPEPWANESWSFFVSGVALTFCLAPATFRWPPASAGSRDIRSQNTSELTAAAYRPRRASGPASRDCRPGHRRPRHRRRRARYSRSARSSFRNYRSSRPPSGGCAPHCSR
ncbi:hypothetical protein SAMN05444171_3701 [Bradyrhizobium lablabi]|jgi:hypothetical protein|uniref:Uncharacterized protein n=2 Tax=Bradyrhizobium TaxID=374 RepID=A0ABY0PNG6_9BRAD|nr:hypothetical protein SAMN05444163_3463 [Bradyrhizobium ottawaense]SED28973.1 hypothetical protein SAMN05444171_3701 [Bradyrhizobium lablabi]SHL32423.1 hypothetical protein SAMN05444321_2541 [Bradyrhizobium lablabi]